MASCPKCGCVDITHNSPKYGHATYTCGYSVGHGVKETACEDCSVKKNVPPWDGNGSDPSKYVQAATSDLLNHEIKKNVQLQDKTTALEHLNASYAISLAKYESEIKTLKAANVNLQVLENRHTDEVSRLKKQISDSNLANKILQTANVDLQNSFTAEINQLKNQLKNSQADANTTKATASSMSKRVLLFTQKHCKNSLEEVDCHINSLTQHNKDLIQRLYVPSEAEKEQKPASKTSVFSWLFGE